MYRPKRSKSRLFSLLLISLALLGWWQRQNIYDNWRLHGYQPAANIVALADSDTMTSSTRRLFYVNHPDLENQSDFNDHCASGSSEQTIVLGCYVKNRGIYLYDVVDPRLSGVEEVTAAHETLHAVYDRLSSSEKKRVNDLITTAYAAVTDQRIKDTIKDYEDAGADTTNELHSILGTEVRNLPPELEAYYGQYFSDRAKIVGYSEQYEAVFTVNKNKLDNLKVQIDQLKTEVSQGGANVKSEESDIDAESDRLNNLRADGRTAEFNAGVDSYNASVRQLKADISALNAKIDRLNGLINDYNSTATLQQGLYKALDSKTAPKSL